MELWVKLIIAAIGGGVISPLFRYLISLRKSQSEDKVTDLEGFKVLQEAWIKEFNELSRKIQEAEKAEESCLLRFEQLDTKFQNLKSSFQTLRNSTPNVPIPIFVKDMNGVYLAFNNAYEIEFLNKLGLLRDECIGKTDTHIWGKKVAERLEIYTKRAIDVGGKVKVREEIPTEIPGVFKNWDIIIYPHQIDGITVGTGGVVIPKLRVEQKN